MKNVKMGNNYLKNNVMLKENGKDWNIQSETSFI